MCRYLLPHKYVLERDTGLHMYMRCRRCNGRKIMRTQASGYQPVDQHWLITGQFSNDVATPPRTK